MPTVVESGTGPVTIEMIRGRSIDPGDPTGGVEVKEVLASDQASGPGGTVLLAVGKPFEEAPSHW